MLTFDVGPKIGLRPLTTSYDGFDVQPLSPTIGAVVSGVELRTATPDRLRPALLDWKVLFFEDQSLTRDEQRAFALQWGELERHPFFSYVQPGQTDVDVVTLAKDAVTAGFENEWHADLTWHAKPSFGAVLRAVEVPEVGGDTLWCDAGAAYDLLAEDVKERIEGLSAVHDWQQSFGLGMPDDARELLAAEFPPSVHPVVRVHPDTGRRLLFVNRIFTQSIVGLPPAESDELLGVLVRQFERPELQCRFRWSPGAVAFWDNRSTLHYASSDYFPARRVMERISIAGDVPVPSPPAS
jgi:taurine dioxygenase